MTKQDISVAVTGVGAIIGYGLLRALNHSAHNVRSLGLDIFADAYGRYIADRFVQVPLTASENYFATLQEILAKEKVQLLIPGFEPDAYFLAERVELLRQQDVALVTNSAELMSFCKDKWLTHLALQTAGFRTIPTLLPSSFEEAKDELGIPFLLKLRQTSASKGMVLVESKADFDYWTGRNPIGYVAQKVVGTPDEEYTVGAFGYGDGESCNPIVLRRTLSREGSTAKATFVSHPDIELFTRALIERFKPSGPTNFQFRCEGESVYLLEINPRVSSSSSLRELFGYREAEMCIDYFLFGRRPTWTPSMAGGHAVRYIADHFVPV